MGVKDIDIEPRYLSEESGRARHGQQSKELPMTMNDNAGWHPVTTGPVHSCDVHFDFVTTRLHRICHISDVPGYPSREGRVKILKDMRYSHVAPHAGVGGLEIAAVKLRAEFALTIDCAQARAVAPIANRRSSCA
jgi:hypothetical protein